MKTVWSRSALRLRLEAPEAVLTSSPSTKIVILTGYGSITNAVEAVKLGAVNYVTKPADADDVLHAFNESANEEVEPEFPPPSLASAQWEHIQRVYELCDRNVSETARRLNMHRRTLQRILAKRSPR